MRSSSVSRGSSQHAVSPLCRVRGLTSIQVDGCEQLGEVWERVRTAQRSLVIELKTDPEVPPLPSHIPPDQARHFPCAPMEGDAAESSVIAKTRVRSWPRSFPARRVDRMFRPQRTQEFTHGTGRPRVDARMARDAVWGR